MLKINFSENDNFGDKLSGYSDPIDTEDPYAILNHIYEEIDFKLSGANPFNEHIEIRVTPNMLKKWIMRCKEHPQEELRLAIVHTSGGYEQYDLEYKK